MSEAEVEQITAPATEPKKPEKDPKKVAAGKRLAEYNKKAKLALEREVQREKEEAAIEVVSKNINIISRWHSIRGKDDIRPPLYNPSY